MNIITSPFGVQDILKLKAAGSTSIVVGSNFFSVRSVTNLSEEELIQAKEICKMNNINLYVLVNRFFMEEDLELLRIYLLKLREIDVDGIYFSDLAVFHEAKKLQMEQKLIYNPDTILTNTEDIQAYLDMGIKMCTISKEITLEDMVSIAQKVKGETEVIVHGRLHMLHSKRLLLTNYMEFIESDKDIYNNHNLYLMEENRDERMPIIEDNQGTHIFTGFTLCSFEELSDLVKSGISNIRIESMYSNIDEVCQIVRDYCYILNHSDEGRAYYQKYQNEYPSYNISKGFLYKKTGAVK